MQFDNSAIRRDFAMLSERRGDQPLAYLDNAGTTLRPRAVIERLVRFEQSQNSSLPSARGDTAETLYADARRCVARFIGAGSADEIVFCRGATEAINFVAQTWGERYVHAGDEILVTDLEHHANLAPWYALAQRRGATVHSIPFDEKGNLRLADLHERIGKRTKLVAITHASNVFGTIPPLREIIAAAHSVGANVLVDGAQAPAHIAIDVAALDADFYTFSGHKVFAPSGIGVLYGKRELLDTMPPWQLGANAIERFDPLVMHCSPVPARFEAGSANVAGAIALAAALDYVDSIGFDAIEQHEAALIAHLVDGLQTLRNVRLLGAPSTRIPLVAFCVQNSAATDIRNALAQQGIEIRAGHLSAQPLLGRFGVEEALRISLAMYNDEGDIERVVAVLERLGLE